VGAALSHARWKRFFAKISNLPHGERAKRGDVLWLFLRESIMLIAAGALIGMPLALWLAVFLRKMLYEVSTSDPLSISVTLYCLRWVGCSLP